MSAVMGEDFAERTCPECKEPKKYLHDQCGKCERCHDIVDGALICRKNA